MIEIKNLTKRFDKTTALDGLNLTVESGTVTGLIGSNGGGKSTLLRILAGVYFPDEGEVLIDGAKPFDNPAVKQCRQLKEMSYPSAVILSGAEGKMRSI